MLVKRDHRDSEHARCNHEITKALVRVIDFGSIFGVQLKLLHVLYFLFCKRRILVQESSQILRVSLRYFLVVR